MPSPSRERPDYEALAEQAAAELVDQFRAKGNPRLDQAVPSYQALTDFCAAAWLIGCKHGLEEGKAILNMRMKS